MAGGSKAGGLGAKARRALFGAAVAGAAFLSAAAAQASTHHYVHHTVAHHTVAHLSVAHEHLRSHVRLASTHHIYTHHVYTHHAYAPHVKAATYRKSSEYHPHYVHEAHYAEVDHHTRITHYAHYRMAQYRHSGLQCVPYAREVSHIELTGNAFLWWAEAAGRYARGDAPVEGAVLNFRAIGRMPLGHVAVVTGVINNRTILVTQANWVPGTITNDVTVQDVSPNNDWSQVRVELGDSSTWGAAYPTYGFIYNKPAGATVIAANGQGNEVAEAPSVQPVSTEGPNRNLQ
jgi:surface antigen